jgi:hypothetical protein
VPTRPNALPNRSEIQLFPLRVALRNATSFAVAEGAIRSCIDNTRSVDQLFERARTDGLSSLERRQRAGHLSRVTGEIAESVAEILLDERGYNLFWQITTPGVHGVDLLFLAPDQAVLALEVKGTLRPGAVPRLTPSLRRQMSREWLNNPDNPAMADWSLEADDLYAGVMVIDLALARFRVALSGDFDLYAPVSSLEQLTSLRWLE